LRENLVKAQNYMKKLERGKEDSDKEPDRDLKMESLVRVLKGEIPLRAHAHRADDTMTAVRIAEEFNVKIVIEHCTEGHKIADELAKRGIPAVVGPSLTARVKVELKDRTFKTPGILAKAGVTVALMTDHPVIPVHYLPLSAALAVRDGMDEEEALKAITINPARICGVDDRLGSLEKGKDADIVVFDRWPLDVNARVKWVIIDGKIVHPS
jgi:imidazolonepropionase-like amidohydrolase